MSVRLIVFDLDGTLVDSKRDLADSVNALLVELGSDRGQTGVRPGSDRGQTGVRPGSDPVIPLPEDRITEMVGEGAAVLVRRALSAAGMYPETPGALSRFLELYNERLLNHTALYPGMADVLPRLARRAVLSVLTNKPSAASERVLAGLGVRGLFQDVFGGDTPFGRKPNPAGLLELIARAGATPATTILVGDSHVDLDTARRAGTRICLARYGFGFRFAPGDFRGTETFIDAPGELAGAVSMPDDKC